MIILSHSSRLVLTFLVIFLIKTAFFMLDGYGLWGCLWEKGLSEVSAGRIHQFLERPREVLLVATHGVEGNFTHGLVVILQELPGRLICTRKIDIHVS
jgi:hypothetical protein